VTGGDNRADRVDNPLVSSGPAVLTSGFIKLGTRIAAVQSYAPPHVIPLLITTGDCNETFDSRRFLRRGDAIRQQRIRRRSNVLRFLHVAFTEDEGLHGSTESQGQQHVKRRHEKGLHGPDEQGPGPRHGAIDGAESDDTQHPGQSESVERSAAAKVSGRQNSLVELIAKSSQGGLGRIKQQHWTAAREQISHRNYARRRCIPLMHRA
jgi:hypothetical protein